MGVGGKNHAPAALSRELSLVSILEGAGWAPQSRSGQVWRRENSLHPPEIETQAVEPVASRYTEYAAPHYRICLDIS